jgi:hypothetical protein
VDSSTCIVAAKEKLTTDQQDKQLDEMRELLNGLLKQAAEGHWEAAIAEWACKGCRIASDA